MKLSENNVRDHESVIFKCFMTGENLIEHRLANYSLILMCEGEIDIFDNNRNLTVKKGEYVFLQRDCRIKIHKHSSGDAPYSAISISFNRPALRNYFRQLNIDHLLADVTRIGSAAIKIAPNLYLDSLFASLRPFLTNNMGPS